jgi:hypothetical protein
MVSALPLFPEQISEKDLLSVFLIQTYRQMDILYLFVAQARQFGMNPL